MMPVEPVCPHCHGPLRRLPETIHCQKCAAQFGYEDGIPNLVVGGRFDDENNEARCAYETDSNEFLTRNYLIPLFRKRLASISQPRLLSLGCGVGIDVDLLSEAGFHAHGIDCGNRAKEWQKRRCLDRLNLANGKALPFEDGAFDLVYCGCVFPHVGVEGDSNRVTPDFLSERLKIAREMTRVLKPGGSVMVSSPNRLFPLDLFHGRSEAQPMPRWNPPSSRFLLSGADYRTLFQKAGCTQFELLPVTGYWGFLRKKQSLKGRVVTWPVRTVFNLVSRESCRFLRSSIINPWLVMMMSLPRSN
jgi:SAM-dependent methyltransferase